MAPRYSAWEMYCVSPGGPSVHCVLKDAKFCSKNAFNFAYPSASQTYTMAEHVFQITRLMSSQLGLL